MLTTCAQPVVVGYPRLFNGEDCNALTWFGPSEESSLNGTADLLDSKRGIEPETFRIPMVPAR